MDKIINKLVEAEHEAHEYVDKASLDKDWATALHEKEFGIMKKKRYEEINAMLADERKQKFNALKIENADAEVNHNMEKQKMNENFAAISEELIEKLFARIINTNDKNVTE